MNIGSLFLDNVSLFGGLKEYCIGHSVANDHLQYWIVKHKKLSSSLEVWFYCFIYNYQV